ncbi:MAG: HlyD family efflux transporter periplasmic adaptor subunit [Pseudomonadota bacterium]
MSFLSRGMWGLFLGLSTVGLLAIAVLEFVRVANLEDEGGWTPPGSGSREVTVNVTEVEGSAIRPAFTVFGEVGGARRLEIRSPEAGQIVYLDPNFKSGAAVTAGTLLAQIDPAPLEASRDLAASDLTNSEADVADAIRTVDIAEQELAASKEQLDLRQAALDRQLSLNERGVGTEAALETAELSLSTAEQSVLTKEQALASAKTALTRARAAVSRAVISLDEAERKLANASITAPFDGVLSDATLIEGMLVSPNERLGSLIDPTALEVSLVLSLSRFSAISSRVADLSDLDVSVQLSDDLPAVPAQIVRADPTVTDGQTGRRIYAALDPAAATLLQPGDFVSVRVTEPPVENLVRLPAMSFGPDGQILVVGENSTLEGRDVPIVARDGDDVFISATGLTGALVVNENTPQLASGIRVKPVINGQPVEEKMVELSEEQKAKFLAFVTGNDRMPDNVKARLIKQIESGAMSEEAFENLNQRVSQAG